MARESDSQTKHAQQTNETNEQTNKQAGKQARDGHKTNEERIRYVLLLLFL